MNTAMQSQSVNSRSRGLAPLRLDQPVDVLAGLGFGSSAVVARALARVFEVEGLERVGHVGITARELEKLNEGNAAVAGVHWCALEAEGVTQLGDKDAHGLGRLGNPALCLRVTLHHQLAQLERGVGRVGNLSGFPAREPSLRNPGATTDLALRQVVLLPQAHQQTKGFALGMGHKAALYATSHIKAMRDRIIFFCIVPA